MPLCSTAIKALRLRFVVQRQQWNAASARFAARPGAALTAVRSSISPERAQKESHP